MVSNGKSLVIKNQTNNQYYFYLLKKTPLELILDKNYLINQIKKLEGKIIDDKGQNVISYGEIVKTSTLRILSDVFKIKNSFNKANKKKKIVHLLVRIFQPSSARIIDFPKIFFKLSNDV